MIRNNLNAIINLACLKIFLHSRNFVSDVLKNRNFILNIPGNNHLEISQCTYFEKAAMNQRFEVYEDAMSTVCSKWSKSEYIDPVYTYRLRMVSNQVWAVWGPMHSNNSLYDQFLLNSVIDYHKFKTYTRLETARTWYRDHAVTVQCIYGVVVWRNCHRLHFFFNLQCSSSLERCKIGKYVTSHLLRVELPSKRNSETAVGLLKF